MKLTIENTDKIVQLENRRGESIPARLWEGVTDSGIPCQVFVTRIGVHDDQPAAAHLEFQQELNECARPIDPTAGVPLRMFID